MLTVCYSPKGGQGCTTVAVALGCLNPDALLIDTSGDAPAAAGLPAPAGPGVCDLLASDQPVTADALDRLTIHGGPLPIVPAGATPVREIEPARWATIAAAVPADRAVVVDAGTNPDVFALPADRRIMVVQACYLALRRAVALPVRPDAVVLVADRYRALTERDIETTLGVPVAATVPIDPLVARAIDAGLLIVQIPSVLARSLQPLTAPTDHGSQRRPVLADREAGQ